MQIPELLQQAIEREVERFGLRKVMEAREELTERYRTRQPEKQSFMTVEAHRCSYLVTRLPATYAAIYTVLQEIRNRMPTLTVRSILDLGAGPGTAMWAACEVFPELETITLIEKDQELIKLGKRLGAYSSQLPITQAQWLSGDLKEMKELPKSDLIILSYSIGELPESTIPSLIETCWTHTQQLLVVIEPGTPIGFEGIRAIRRQLIGLNSHMVAPCPHTVACPMAHGDWCHFSARVERTSLHRRVKSGALGYEDEKFSYVAVSKDPCQLPETRILRHPLKRSGHIILTLCTDEGVKKPTISKKEGDLYKIAKQAEWGSPFP